MAPSSPMLRAGDRHGFPIGEMARQDQHALAAHVCQDLTIFHPDTGIRAMNIEFVEMGIFRHRAAQIVPHHTEDGFALGV